MGVDSKWVPVCPAEAVEEAMAFGCRIAETEICLYRVQGKVYASADRCTHGNARLSEGYVEEGEIECPYHQGRFDIRTGEPTSPPCSKPLPIYPAEERDGTIWVEIR